MNNIKLISTVFICINLLNGCGFASKSVVNSQQNINQNKTDIENLPNGNYRYCSEPASKLNTNSFDGEAWCFEFNKKGDDIVGTYSYQAPKDTAQICIEGQAKNNQITGTGYEIIEYGETKPDIEKERLAISQEKKPYLSKKKFWEDDVYPNGNNLIVKKSQFYKLLESKGLIKSYRIKIRYNISQLYLDNFYKRELTEYYYQEKIKKVYSDNKCI